jgi:hypothetical protein
VVWFWVDEQSVYFHVCVGCDITVDVVYIGHKYRELYVRDEVSLGQGVHQSTFYNNICRSAGS